MRSFSHSLRAWAEWKLKSAVAAAFFFLSQEIAPSRADTQKYRSFFFLPVGR